MEKNKKPEAQWELCLTAQQTRVDGSMASVEQTADAGVARWTPGGMDFPETTTAEGLFSLLRALKAFDDWGLVALADIFIYARSRGWDSEVESALGELEFDMATVQKALAVGDVPRGLRHPSLNAEHYYVVSKLLIDEQTKWLARAVRHKMTAFVLKRSIEAGKVLTQEAIEVMSGSGSGILNYGGILTNWNRWEKRVGGEEAILGWPRDVLQRWYDDVKPIGALLIKADARLNS